MCGNKIVHDLCNVGYCDWLVLLMMMMSYCVYFFSTKSLLLLIDCKYKLMSKSEVENGHGVNSGHESPIPFDRDLEYGDVGKSKTDYAGLTFG